MKVMLFLVAAPNVAKASFHNLQHEKLSFFSSSWSSGKHNLAHDSPRKCSPTSRIVLPKKPQQQPYLLFACTYKTTHLFNFLDDYKSEQEMGSENENGDTQSQFPPPICESEIHRVVFSTTAGDFIVSVDKALSPSGVTRFLQLVDDGFFQDQLLYRILPGFLIQFGVAAHPSMQSKWDPNQQQEQQSLASSTPACIPDEPNRATFKHGTLSFAGSGIDSRSCHMFIALEPYGENLGSASHETTLGWVEQQDLHVLDRLVANAENAGYCNQDMNFLQQRLATEGNNQVASEYPLLDRIMGCQRI